MYWKDLSIVKTLASIEFLHSIKLLFFYRVWWGFLPRDLDRGVDSLSTFLLANSGNEEDFLENRPQTHVRYSFNEGKTQPWTHNQETLSTKCGGGRRVLWIVIPHANQVGVVKCDRPEIESTDLTLEGWIDFVFVVSSLKNSAYRHPIWRP